MHSRTISKEIRLQEENKGKLYIHKQERTCAVSDFITSFAALVLVDSSAASAIASRVFFVDFSSSTS